MLQKIIKLFSPSENNNYCPVFLSNRFITISLLLFLIFKAIFELDFVFVAKKSALFADINAQKIIELTNEKREEFGLPPLKENELLTKAAQEKAEDMIRNKYFSHNNPYGIAPWNWIEKNGYHYYYAGENLAMNFFDGKDVVEAWLNSSSHRENILNKNYKDTGVAVAYGDITNEGQNKAIVVQMFGSKNLSLTETAKNSFLSNLNQLPDTTIPKKQEDLPKTNPDELSLNETNPLEDESEQKEIAGLENQIKESALPLQQPALLFLKIKNLIGKEAIRKANRLIAGFLIGAGLITIVSVVFNKNKLITKGQFSELLIRSFIIIFAGTAFTYFRPDYFLGKLIIS